MGKILDLKVVEVNKEDLFEMKVRLLYLMYHHENYINDIHFVRLSDNNYIMLGIDDILNLAYEAFTTIDIDIDNMNTFLYYIYRTRHQHNYNNRYFLQYLEQHGVK